MAIVGSHERRIEDRRQGSREAQGLGGLGLSFATVLGLRALGEERGTRTLRGQRSLERELGGEVSRLILLVSGLAAHAVSHSNCTRGRA
jgi:hypothetical protein